MRQMWCTGIYRTGFHTNEEEDMKKSLTHKMITPALTAGAMALVLGSMPLHAANPCNPCSVKNPCAAKAVAMNPCAAKNPCAVKNPCAAKNPCSVKNPCAAKNPCSAKKGW